MLPKSTGKTTLSLPIGGWHAHHLETSTHCGRVADHQGRAWSWRELGKRYSQPYQDVLRLRRGVESLLRAKGDGLTLLQACATQSLCRLEFNCRIAELTIQDRPDMPTEELRSHRESIGRWTRERDNALEALLGDGRATADPWAALGCFFTTRRRAGGRGRRNAGDSRGTARDGLRNRPGKGMSMYINRQVSMALSVASAKRRAERRMEGRSARRAAAAKRRAERKREARP